MNCKNKNDNRDCLIAFGLCSTHKISLNEAFEVVSGSSYPCDIDKCNKESTTSGRLSTGHDYQLCDLHTLREFKVQNKLLS